MKDFIKSLFSDKDGSISSKRLIMFSFVYLFILIVIANLFWGKMIAEPLLSSLVTLIWASIGSVFGENVTNIFSRKPDPK